MGKTALLTEFARDRRAIFHTASGRPRDDELRLLSLAARDVVGTGVRDLSERPFTDWADALETLAGAADDEPLLVVLDEFPELVRISPELESTLRAVWDRIRTRTKLRVFLSGSAVRTMQAIQEERSPLYGRIDLVLHLRPFEPHEAAKMLPRLRPSDRALVWSIVGGTPLYLEWWDDGRSVRDNVRRLVCAPAGLLLHAGELALATDLDTGGLARQIVFAIGAGRTKHNEIADAVRAEPARALDQLIELGVIERIAPVTEDPRRTRRRRYRIGDNFLAFWLGVVDRYRADIERGLGESILPVLLDDLDDFAGPRWEEAFRAHLRRRADAGEIASRIVAIGPYWNVAQPPVEIDAVALAGRSRTAVLAGEAKWARSVDGARLRRDLERKAEALPNRADDLRFALCARERIEDSGDALTVTAADIFG
ncbi:MAG: ATP-binding protein [Actinobacteria bacterium]|nr:ATP-binding protein [Actinomycetota bacterium]